MMLQLSLDLNFEETKPKTVKWFREMLTTLEVEEQPAWPDQFGLSLRQWLLAQTTFEAFCEAAQHNPNAAYIWLDCLARIEADDTLKLLHRIPSHLISKTAIEFAQKILEINQNRLLKFQETLQMTILFLAWQDPESRSWFPIGSLTFDGEYYQFIYTQNVK